MRWGQSRPVVETHEAPYSRARQQHLWQPVLLISRSAAHLVSNSCGFAAAVLRRLRHPAIVEFKGVGAMRSGSADSMRRSMFLVQVC